MKKVFLTVILGILSITLGAQVSFDSVVYKAFQKVTLSYNERDTASSDILFWFVGNKVSLTTNDQTKNLYFIKFFEETLKTGHRVKRVQCKDDGGFNCVLSTGFDSGFNFISVEYNNTVFFYKVAETTERPWDNDPVEIKTFESCEDKGAFSPEEVNALAESWKRFKVASQPLKFW
jgi:hypothetical protein